MMVIQNRMMNSARLEFSKLETCFLVKWAPARLNIEQDLQSHKLQRLRILSIFLVQVSRHLFETGKS